LLDAWGPGNSRSSSGGETRVLRGIYGQDRIYSQWVARSIELWRNNQQRWGVELYRRIGALWMFAADDAYVREALPSARELGFRVDPLEPGGSRPPIPADSARRRAEGLLRA
jgi:sarcosine oxidase